MSSLRWLHFSDLHWSAERQRAQRNFVIDDLWKKVETICADVRPDMVFFTGDIANSGQADEYEAAYEKFFSPLLEHSDLDPSRLFVVPGNHDLDWRECKKILGAYEQLKDNRDEFKEDHIEELCTPFRNFKTFRDRLYDGQSAAPDDHLHGAASTSMMKIDGLRVGVACLNSALLHYAPEKSEPVAPGHLRLGLDQVNACKQALAKADFKIALLHHPISWFNEALADERLALDLLRQEFDFILHGHEHDADVIEMTTPRFEYVAIPAGAIFQGLVENNRLLRNGFTVVDCEPKIRSGSVHFYNFDGRWYVLKGPTEDGHHQFGMHRDLIRRRHAVTKSLAQTRTVKALMSEVLKEAERLIDGEQRVFYFVLAKHDFGHAQVKAVRGQPPFPAQFGLNLQFPNDPTDSLSTYAMAICEPVSVDDVTENAGPGSVDRFRPVRVGDQMPEKSGISAPITYHSALDRNRSVSIGALTVCSAKKADFTDEHLETLDFLAHLAGSQLSRLGHDPELMRLFERAEDYLATSSILKKGVELVRETEDVGLALYLADVQRSPGGAYHLRVVGSASGPGPFDEQWKLGYTFPLNSQSMTGRAILGLRESGLSDYPVVIPDTVADPTYRIVDDNERAAAALGIRRGDGELAICCVFDRVMERAKLDQLLKTSLQTIGEGLKQEWERGNAPLRSRIPVREDPGDTYILESAASVAKDLIASGGARSDYVFASNVAALTPPLTGDAALSLLSELGRWLFQAPDLDKPLRFAFEAIERVLIKPDRTAELVELEVHPLRTYLLVFWALNKLHLNGVEFNQPLKELNQAALLACLFHDIAHPLEEFAKYLISDELLRVGGKVLGYDVLRAEEIFNKYDAADENGEDRRHKLESFAEQFGDAWRAVTGQPLQMPDDCYTPRAKGADRQSIRHGLLAAGLFRHFVNESKWDISEEVEKLVLGAILFHDYEPPIRGNASVPFAGTNVVAYLLKVFDELQEWGRKIRMSFSRYPKPLAGTPRIKVRLGDMSFDHEEAPTLRLRVDYELPNESLDATSQTEFFNEVLAFVKDISSERTVATLNRGIEHPWKFRLKVDLDFKLRTEYVSQFDGVKRPHMWTILEKKIDVGGGGAEVEKHDVRELPKLTVEPLGFENARLGASLRDRGSNEIRLEILEAGDEIHVPSVSGKHLLYIALDGGDAWELELPRRRHQLQPQQVRFVNGRLEHELRCTRPGERLLVCTVPENLVGNPHETTQRRALSKASTWQHVHTAEVFELLPRDLPWKIPLQIMKADALLMLRNDIARWQGENGEKLYMFLHASGGALSGDIESLERQTRWTSPCSVFVPPLCPHRLHITEASKNSVVLWVVRHPDVKPMRRQRRSPPRLGVAEA